MDFGRELLPLDGGRNHDRGGADKLLLRLFFFNLEVYD